MLNITSLKVDEVLLIIIIALLIFLLVHKHWTSRPSDSNQPEELGISSFVEKVRTELYQAEEKRLKTNEAALFKLDKFDLEINFVVKSSLTANGSITHELVTVSGQTETSSEKVQKITLHMIAASAEKYKQPVEKNPIQGEEVKEYETKPPATKGGNP